MEGALGATDETQRAADVPPCMFDGRRQGDDNGEGGRARQGGKTVHADRDCSAYASRSSIVYLTSEPNL
jgi:hypothetical protein